MRKLSIITINYNNLEGLKRTVERVVNQTWQEFEYIIIDGGSTDGSAEYIESQSSNFDYWISEKDFGIYNAMNKGIKVATGEYLLFLNSGDDFFNNIILEENIQHIDNYDLIYFDVELRGGDSLQTIEFPDKLNFSFFNNSTLCHQSVIIKKEMFNNIGFYDETLKIVSDWKFFILALFKHNCSYLRVNTILSGFYLGGICSDPNNSEIINMERKQVLQSEFPGFIKDMNSLLELRLAVSYLRKSIIIRILIKLKLLKKF